MTDDSSIRMMRQRLASVAMDGNYSNGTVQRSMTLAMGRGNNEALH
jgi:hypothetical protein